MAALWCVIVFGVMLAGCGPTAVRAVWKQDDFEGRFSKVLVSAQFPDSAERTLVEEAMVADLVGRGVEAVAVGTLLPDRDVSNLDDIFAVLPNRDFGGALVVYLMGKAKRSTSFRRKGTMDKGQGFYAEATSVTATVALVEADLYAAADRRRVWFIVTETFLRDDLPADEKAVSSLVDALGDSLAGKKLLAR